MFNKLILVNYDQFSRQLLEKQSKQDSILMRIYLDKGSDRYTRHSPEDEPQRYRYIHNY